MVGVLYCRKSCLSYEKVINILAHNHIEAVAIALEDYPDIMGYNLIVNLTGKYYDDRMIAKLVTYFEHGGRMIHLGSAPFTKNICDERNNNNRVLRAFEIVDDFLPVDDGEYIVKSLEDNKEQKMYLSGLQSAIYHLCLSGNRDAHLEHIVDAYGMDGELKAAVVIRVVTDKKGNMTFFNLNLTDEMLSLDLWNRIFIQAVNKELSGTLLLDGFLEYARYYPDEDISLKVCCENKDCLYEDVKLEVGVCDHDDNIVYTYSEHMDFPYENELTFKVPQSSIYTVTVTAYENEHIIRRITTGFLVIGDEQIQREMTNFKPLYIDEKVSSDYCLCDGKITPILGTTYFVTDVYRECFARFNVALCESELKQLAKDGFNTLRSGYWKHNDGLYNEDGSISKSGVRALQAFFVMAERFEFTVQFALGNVMLNQWDDKVSPIHDKDMRRKCMTLVKSFAQNFSGYSNVMLDIVNEPSYSMRGAWTLGRPSYEAGELANFRKWLADKYGEISNLWDAWGETALSIPDFDDAQLPEEELFARLYFRTEQRRNNTYLADFYEFARSEFSDWVREVRSTVKAFAPEMVVTMGRDETLRIPAQQDEVLAGNVDMVCWHQWGKNGAVHIEQLLNRVRGKICVAQELGVYQFDDIRSGKRFNEYERMTKMEQKMLCAQGNFIQWQSFHDPFLYELSENALGLYRADHSPSLSKEMVTKLIEYEKSGAKYMSGRNDEKIKILTLYGTSHYFSVDSALAQSGLRNHINVLYNALHEQTNLVLEHLFDVKNKKMIGNPNLVILPAMQMLSQKAWDNVLEYVKAGGVALVNGVVDKNEFFKTDEKIAKIDHEYETEKMQSFENISIEGREYSLDFRPMLEYADVANVLDCGNCSKIKKYQVGTGTIIYCPYPVELSSNMEAVEALYTYAIKIAKAQNEIYREVKCNPNVLFMATAYEQCTVYTLINYGRTDFAEWTDCSSDRKFILQIPDARGCKLWVSKDGEVLQMYGDAILQK